MIGDFKAFLIKQNVLALALAVVVGTALNTLVKAIVDGFIMPIISALTPGGAWQAATWTVGPLHFSVGLVLAALLNFVIIGIVAWRISRVFIRETPTAATKMCEQCRMTIDAAARRCPHCTSQLAA